MGYLIEIFNSIYTGFLYKLKCVSYSSVNVILIMVKKNMLEIAFTFNFNVAKIINILA